MTTFEQLDRKDQYRLLKKNLGNNYNTFKLDGVCGTGIGVNEPISLYIAVNVETEDNLNNGPNVYTINDGWITYEVPVKKTVTGIVKLFVLR